MGKKGGQHHLKRLPAPDFWPIPKKKFRWVVKPRAGSHKLSRCIPLLLVVRDILQLVKTRREVKFLISKGHVKVDGRIKKNDDYPVGLMDVIEIPLIEKAYRALPISKKNLILHPITGEEREFKLCKIVNKTIVKGDKLQLNLHDGRNIILEVQDPKTPKEDLYNTRDTLNVKIPNIEISAHLKLEEGVLAIVTGGKNMGRWGEVVDIEKRKSLHKPTITLDDRGNPFKTILDYVFVVGKGMPWISLPGENEL